MNKLKYLFLSICSLFYTMFANAQSKTGGIKRSEEPTDFMRSNGKIYVVVAVIVIILSGLFIYLYNLDKKMTSLEKRSSNT